VQLQGAAAGRAGVLVYGGRCICVIASDDQTELGVDKRSDDSMSVCSSSLLHFGSNRKRKADNVIGAEQPSHACTGARGEGVQDHNKAGQAGDSDDVCMHWLPSTVVSAASGGSHFLACTSTGAHH
jgi:hypothetical protein